MEKISGVNICGFIDGEFGLGEGVRATIRALETQGIPMAMNNAQLQTIHRRQDKNYESLTSENPFPINIIQLNGDAIQYFKRTLASHYFENKYNIGYWAWELPNFPSDWTLGLCNLNELWTPSNFCVEALSQNSTIPILKMPHSIGIPENAVTRSQLKLPPDKFIFLFIFDFSSVTERKNPLAVIEAFKLAFGADERGLLVLKSINGDSYKEQLQEVKTAVKDASNIKIIDEVWDRNDIWGLLKNCDAYVSLHRSEGFGLTIAEAMFCGKPVIATDYSANSEYMNINNSFPVRYRLENIKEDCGHYKKGGTWAEPDIKHAAELMRKIFDFPEQAQHVGERAARDAQDLFSTEAVGHRMRQRLEYIHFICDDFRDDSNSSETIGQNIRQKINKLDESDIIADLKNRIKMMEASRFWKIRNHWFRLKGFWRGKS